MKRSLSKILFFLVLSTCATHSQSWFPNQVGNVWQYLTVEGWYFNISEIHAQYGLMNLTIIADTVIENQSYCKWTSFPNHWLRYDSVTAKIFVRYENADSIYRDFSLITDTTIWLFDPSINHGRRVEVTESSINFNDSVLICKRFHSWYYSHPVLADYYDYFTPGLGLICYKSSANDPPVFWSWEDFYLLQANINGQNYSENYSPEIISDSITIISNSIFVDTIQVKHHYNHIFPSSSFIVGINFIDSVYIESIYSKEDSVIINPAASAYNIPYTDQWFVNFPLNSGLLNEGFRFKYRIKAIDKGLVPHICILPDTGYFIAVYDTTTFVENSKLISINYTLFQNYPNPFNPYTKIKFNIRTYCFVTLKVYDTLGNEIVTLINGEKLPGEYEIEFNATQLPSGVYFYRLRAGSFIQTKKMIYLK